jgi:hypothetical protein
VKILSFGCIGCGGMGRHVLQVEKAILESVQTGQVIDYPQFLARWGTAQPRR